MIEYFNFCYVKTALGTEFALQVFYYNVEHIFKDSTKFLFDFFLFFFSQDYSIKQASIFTGEEELFAFERTVSRLTEMQTADYWQNSRSHRKGMETELLL